MEKLVIDLDGGQWAHVGGQRTPRAVSGSWTWWQGQHRRGPNTGGGWDPGAVPAGVLAGLDRDHVRTDKIRRPTPR